MRTFYRQPWVMVASDGGIGVSHPRGAGTFPRVLGRFVRDEKWLTLPEAIRKMTSLAGGAARLEGSRHHPRRDESGSRAVRSRRRSSTCRRSSSRGCARAGSIRCSSTVCRCGRGDRPGARPGSVLAPAPLTPCRPRHPRGRVGAAQLRHVPRQLARSARSNGSRRDQDATLFARTDIAVSLAIRRPTWSSMAALIAVNIARPST